MKVEATPYPEPILYSCLLHIYLQFTVEDKYCATLKWRCGQFSKPGLVKPASLVSLHTRCVTKAAGSDTCMSISINAKNRLVVTLSCQQQSVPMLHEARSDQVSRFDQIPFISSSSRSQKIKKMQEFRRNDVVLSTEY